LLPLPLDVLGSIARNGAHNGRAHSADVVAWTD
jgi:hypothetical protein